MLFNSLDFLIFFTIFFVLYWLFANKNIKHQNLLLLFSSYVFYSFTDYRFLLYLVGVSLLNYVLGISIEKSSNYKKTLMYIGVIQGIAGLVFFKYFNFFIDSFNNLFYTLNINLNLETLNILIPLGISFFTFRTISYVLDVYNENIKATKDWLVFFNYVAFFPSILSGPIDKSKLFVPQLEKNRIFNYKEASSGIRQILWGLFKKVVVADNCLFFVNEIFDNNTDYSGATLLVGAIFFSFQLYADFSGYSDMAIGVSRVLGFNISKNFDFPFFSQNIAEFWRKWHISLTSWLTEYVFTPLNFSLRKLGKTGLIISILINFTICGIWHGANWTYIIFGFLHGCLFIPLILNETLNKHNKLAQKKNLPSFKELVNMLSIFFTVTLTFIVFRSENISHTLIYFSEIFSSSLFLIPETPSIKVILFVSILILLEWYGRKDEYAIEKIFLAYKKSLRWFIYLVFVLLILYYAGEEKTFYYFQF